jgi:predicted CoA-substrate-specific enzyme activase
MQNMTSPPGLVAGIDIGTECVKTIVLGSERTILGRAVLPARGPFQDRAHEALLAALDEAGARLSDLADAQATGFGANCALSATGYSSEPVCHGLGAFYHFPQAMTVIDIGGREPTVIRVDARGRSMESRVVRRCGIGIGTFLMFAARHLDVHPTRLEELAAAADRPANIGSYCSVFAGTEILERLREGVSREEIALGCIHSIAERVCEIGGFVEPILVTGGVAEFFPGVLKALGERIGMSVQAVPEPISAGALGAAVAAAERRNGGR